MVRQAGGPANTADTASRRPPVVTEQPSGNTLDACSREWKTHTERVHDQPREVLDAAFQIFRDAYDRQPVAGPKARSFVLVAMLYSTRLL